MPNGGGTKRSTASTGEMMTDQEKRNRAATGETCGVGAQSTSPQAMSPADPLIASVSPPTAVDGYEPARSTTPFSLTGLTPTLFNMKRASRAPTIIPRSAAITRIDLIASAERIFFRYLSQAGNAINSSENHEIYLPPSLRIHSFLLSSTQESMTQNEPNLVAQIPDMFHAQKECCFRAMEQDAFPRSLRSKAFGNLTPALVTGGWVDCTLDWAGGRILVNLLRCAAEIETLFLIYTIQSLFSASFLGLSTIRRIDGFTAPVYGGRNRAVEALSKFNFYYTATA